MDIVSPQALGSDIEYPLRSNALSAKSVLDGRVALTGGLITEMEEEAMEAGAGGGLMGIQRTFWRVGVGPTLTRRPVRIESGRLS